jgi:tRNA A-37 threonylcarbamoyl transferase component Bud32
MIATRICPQCRNELPADAPEGLCPRCLLQGAFTDAPQPEREQPTTSGDAFAAPSLAELAPLFPHLEILELLGQGGMGAVYKARQVKLDRLVALKVLPREAGRDPAFAERFGREARALARLQHPGIVAIHDIGEASGLYYLILEYVDGINLRQLLQGGHLPPEQALKIVPQVCEALQYAHDAGIVHRDIKPENILLDRQGRVKIADFGLAKLLGRPMTLNLLTGSRQVMGTPHYMAPEQVEHPLAVDHRADIYSLGVVFYELLTGELPLGRFPPPSRRVQVDVRLDEVVLHALERDPARRYQQVREVKTAVDSLTQEPPAAPEPKEEPPEKNTLAADLAALGGIVLGLVLLFGLYAWWLHSVFLVIGVPLLVSFAQRIPWGSAAKLYAGLVLALGGLAFFVFAEQQTDFGRLKETEDVLGLMTLLMAAAWSLAQVLVLLGVEGIEAEEDEQTVKKDGAPMTGLSTTEQEVLRVLKQFSKAAGLYLLPKLPAEGLHNARKNSKVPPTERILAMLDFTGDGDDATQSLLFGSSGIYFHVEKDGEEITHSVPYADFGRRSFVNHGKEVYLGDDVPLTPPEDFDTVSCETICNILNALKQANGQGPPARNETGS